MDDVHTKRELYGADIVAMIIDDSEYCGKAWLGPRESLMFSVVTDWNCVTGYFSFGHEIGHNQGLNHDRGTKDALVPQPTTMVTVIPMQTFAPFLRTATPLANAMTMLAVDVLA